MRLGSLRIRGQTLPPFPAWGWFLVGRGALSRTGACYREAVQTREGTGTQEDCKVCSISEERSIHHLGCSSVDRIGTRGCWGTVIRSLLCARPEAKCVFTC